MSNSPSQRLWPLLACALLALGVLAWWQTRPAAHKIAPKKAVTKSAASPVANTSTSRNPSASKTPPPPPDPNDPRTALAAALEQPDPRLRTQQFSQLLSQWIARDPEAALGYVRELPR